MGTSFSSPGNAEELRQEARQAFEDANKCYKDSQDAWNNGDKALAKSKKDERIAFQNKAKSLNKQAADIIYADKNSNRKDNEIDLHGLTVSEALAAVEEAIKVAKQKRLKTLVIITGRGNNSPNGAKIKPAVTEQLIQKYSLQVTANFPNPGCITIEFAEPGGFIGWVTTHICTIQ